MLVCATLFWAGNFAVRKFAFIENVPPYSLAFLDGTCLVYFVAIYFQRNF